MAPIRLFLAASALLVLGLQPTIAEADPVRCQTTYVKQLLRLKKKFVQLQNRCIDKQKRAMKKALAYTKKYDPPAWKIHLCNRRAVQRRSGRIDWISYYNCIRNPAVQRSTASRADR